MKLFVATDQTQGAREGDFHRAIAGELLYLLEPCGRDRFDPDGSCGCGRAFIGLNSHGGTTTALVRDSDLTLAGLFEAVASSRDQAGWGRAGAGALVRQIITLADPLPVGTIVGRRLVEVFIRLPAYEESHRD
jgi:hypothetical protein